MWSDEFNREAALPMRYEIDYVRIYDRSGARQETLSKHEKHHHERNDEVLGNGGAKLTRTYEEDTELSGYVMDLQKFDKVLIEAQKNGTVTIEKNISQRELARRLGKRESEVSRWLTGRHNFTTSTIAKIETALGSPLVQITR